MGKRIENNIYLVQIHSLLYNMIFKNNNFSENILTYFFISLILLYIKLLQKAITCMEPAVTVKENEQLIKAITMIMTNYNLVLSTI